MRVGLNVDSILVSFIVLLLTNMTPNQNTTHNRPLDVKEEGCDHKHFSSVCNTCQTDMIEAALEKQAREIGDEAAKREKNPWTFFCQDGFTVDWMQTEAYKRGLVEMIEITQKYLSANQEKK